MENIIITGCGRSGTSLVAGLFAKSGYFYGGKTYPANQSNPKGYFECEEINSINETILSHHLPRRNFLIEKIVFKHKKFGRNQRWLASLNQVIPVIDSYGVKDAIQEVTQNYPFCFKDPRFSFTLPVWLPYLESARFICVFREPSITIKSMIRECNTRPYLKNLKYSAEQALQSWKKQYLQILHHHSRQGKWFFMHIDQAFNGLKLNELEIFSDAKVDREFADANLKSATEKQLIYDSESMNIYQALCMRAGYQQ